jgi:hypothetical protein
MKKINLVTALICIFLSISGCKKEGLPNENIQKHKNPASSDYQLKNFVSEADQLNYAKEKLGYIAKAIAGLTDDATFKSILATSVTNSYNATGEDSCILIEELITVCTLNSYNLTSKAQEILDENGIDEDFSELVHSMKNIGGINYYPQIFIPELEEEAESEIIYTVPYWEDDSYENYTIYTKGDEPYEIDSTTGHDTTSLMSKHIWVISVNECVDNDGELTHGTTGEALDSSGSELHSPIEYWQQPKNKANNLIYSLYGLTIKEHKESFLSGMSDVYIKRYICNESLAMTNIDLNDDKYYGDKVHRFTRYMVRNHVGATPYFHYVTKNNWDIHYRPIMAVLIYERDPLRWNRESKIPISIANNKEITVKYPSTDIYYLSTIFTNTNTPYPYNLFHILNYTIQYPLNNQSMSLDNILN